MPNFEEKSYPYEVLIRFDEHKLGELKAAHQRRINLVLKDGEIFSAVVGEALPVDLTDFAVSGLMSEATEAALKVNSQLQADLAAMRGLNAVLNSGMATANTQIDQLQQANASLAAGIEQVRASANEASGKMQGALAAANATIGQLRGDKADLTTQVTELQAQISKLNGDLAAANATVGHLQAQLPSVPAEAESAEEPTLTQS